MKLIVAGGRKYTDYEAVRHELDDLHIKKSITEIVCGMCNQGIQTYKEILPQGKVIAVYGADGLGYRWAKENNILIAEFPADWRSFRLKAGPLRNGKMADYADALIAFPGTAGTNDMVDKARKMNLIIFDRRNIG